MSDTCNHNCEECSQADCSSRSLIVSPHKSSKIKKVIGIVSGKGGVGKSLVTSLLAVAMKRRDYSVAILDADVTGPSIPKLFGIKEKAAGNDELIIPVPSKTGIKIMSVNLLLDNDTDPIIWRGPLIADLVKRFWSTVLWDQVDYMFVDMPPGTGDVPLTVFQSIPLNGIIVVTSPQDLVSMIVSKAVSMAEQMNVPVIGLVENMSYFRCPGCGKEYRIFGESHIAKIAEQYDIPLLSEIPLMPELASGCDKGLIELADDSFISKAADAIEKL